MSFYDVWLQYRDGSPERDWTAVTDERVLAALSREYPTLEDFRVLLSPRAAGHLEAMAQRAHAVTLRHFGRTLLLYAPLYLSNHCQNECVYCGFNARNPIARRHLAPAEVRREAEVIAATGIRHLLVLTGENRTLVSSDYLRDSLAVLKQHFLSLGIEIYAADQEEYTALIAAGAEQLTLYQETYHEDVYRRVHPRGPKADFRYRLEAPERAGAAGMRGINIGALLGLDRWERDAFFVGLHADYLQRRFPAVEIGVSLPRLRPHSGTDFTSGYAVTDANAVQFLLALRLFLPRAGLTLSTRERAGFRDAVLRLGVTRLSAGSSTAVGGYAGEAPTPGQFEISDQRSVDEMREAIRRQGYQPIFTDWQPRPLEA